MIKKQMYALIHVWFYSPFILNFSFLLYAYLFYFISVFAQQQEFLLGSKWQS